MKLIIYSTNEYWNVANDLCESTVHDVELIAVRAERGSAHDYNIMYDMHNLFNGITSVYDFVLKGTIDSYESMFEPDLVI